MNRTYTVTHFHMRDDVDFSRVPAAPIDQFAWRTGYAPEAMGRVAFVPGDAFFIRLSACECDPLARFTAPGSPVCLDSALEFFADFAGDGRNYLNLEMNANGALLAQFGPGRAERRDVSTLFPVQAGREGDFWFVTVTVTVSRLGELFGLPDRAFETGYTFRANFYKCGDETPQPHYGMWNRVEWEIPDFHRPEQFGTLRLAQLSD